MTGRWAAIAAIAVAALGCGYRLAHAPADPLGPFAVAAGRAHVPDAAAQGAVEEGARAELARAGQLAAGEGGGTIEIEILRIDEAGEGLAAVGGEPLARGVRVTVVGRAVLRRAGSAAVLRDTGDVRAGEVVRRADGAAAGVVAADSGTRAAARRLGEILVRRLLGFPEPGDP